METINKITDTRLEITKTEDTKTVIEEATLKDQKKRLQEEIDRIDYLLSYFSV